MTLSVFTKKAKLGLIAGAGLALFAIGASACTAQSSPKNEFLSRLEKTATATKLTQDYELSLDVASDTGYDSLINGLSIYGESTTDGKNAEVTVNVDGLESLGFTLSEAHFVVYEDAMYLNTLAMFEFLAQRYNAKITAPEDEYVELSDMAEGFAFGSEYTDEFRSSAKLNKEISTAIGKYLATLGDDKFVKEDKTGYISLKLENDQLKEVVRTSLEVMIESKNYTGDKEPLKDFLADFDTSFDKMLQDIELVLTLSQGETLGDNKLTLDYSSKAYGDGTITLEAQGKDYKTPEKPTTIISYEEFTSQLEEAFMSTTVYE